MDTVLPLAKMIRRLFERWQLSVDDQTALLGGLDPRYLEEALLGDLELQKRAEHLLEIHRCLRVIFPKNPDMAYHWVAQPNRTYDNRPPLEVMKRGFDGLEQVRRYLKAELCR